MSPSLRSRPVAGALCLAVAVLVSACGSQSTTTPGPLDAKRSLVTVTRSIDVAVGHDRSLVMVKLFDANKNPISGLNVTLSATGSGNDLVQPDGPTSGYGMALGSLGSTVAEVKTITATVDTSAGSVVLDMHPTVTFIPYVPKPASLSFTVQPSAVKVGQRISPAVQVSFLDESGATTPVTDTVTVALGSDAAAVLGGTVTVSAVDGVATFADLTLDTAGDGFTLIATAERVADPATSDPFAVTEGAAAQLVLSAFSTTAVAGEPGSITVTAQDSAGMPVVGYAGTVTFSSTDSLAELPADFTFTADDAGVHVFSGIVFKTAGARTLKVDDGTMSATAGITVQPATAARLTASGLPNPFTAGATATLHVTAYDAFDNVATGYAGTLTFTSNDTQAQLPTDYTFAATDLGAHDFDNISLRTGTVGATRANVTVTDTEDAALTASQGSILVVPAPASSLVIANIPTAYGPAGTQVTNFSVTAKDVWGNTAVGYRGTVHFTSTDLAAVLPSDYGFVAMDSGSHATFSLTLKTPGTQSVTVTDTVTSALTATVANITVDVPPSQFLQVTNIPNPYGKAGVAHAATVTVKSSSGNVVTGYAGTVKITTSLAPTVVLATYTFVPATDNGVHVIPITLTKAGTYDVVATDTVTATITGKQTGIQVDPGDANGLLIGGISGTLDAGKAYPFDVTAVDAYGNTATGYAGIVHFTSNSAAAQLPANYSFVPATDHGAHSFSATYVTPGAANLVATDTVTASINGSVTGLTVQIGAAAKLAFFVQPANVAFGSNITPAVVVEIQDAAGNLISGATSTVALALGTIPAPGTGVLTGGTGVAAVGGKATFAALSINVVANGYTLVASSGTLTSATSNAFNVTNCAAGFHPGAVDPAHCYDACTDPNPCPATRTTCKNGTTFTTFTETCALDASAQGYACNDTLPGTDTACTGTNVCFGGACIADSCLGVTCTPSTLTCFDLTSVQNYTSACAVTGVGTHACNDSPSTTTPCGAGGVCFGGACQATATQVAAVRTAIGAASATPVALTSLPVYGAIVTYVKASVGGAAAGTADGAGFVVQAPAAAGPAIFVAMDPASFLTAGTVTVGDMVGFVATQGAWVGCATLPCSANVALYAVTAVTSPVRLSQANALPGPTDFSAGTTTTLPVPAVANWNNEAVNAKVTAKIVTSFLSAGGFTNARITTTGVTASNANFKMRIPDALVTTLGLTNGSFFIVSGTPLWHTGTEVDVAAWVAADFVGVSPVVLSSSPDGLSDQPLTAQSFTLTFNTALDPATVSTMSTDGACDAAKSVLLFTDNGVSCVAATASLDGTGKVLTVTPAANFTAGKRYRVGVNPLLKAPVAAGALATLVYSQPAGIATASGATCTTTQIVISQVYGGGGNTGSYYKNDFIELHNRGSAAFTLPAAWSVQYSSANATGAYTVTQIPSGTVIPAGGYLLVQELAGAGGTADLPTPEVVGTIAMSGTDAKVALVSGTTPVTGGCPAVGTLSIVDFVAYGTTSCGAVATPSLSSVNAAVRTNLACNDTVNNYLDFAVVPANPHNGASTANTCTCP